METPFGKEVRDLRTELNLRLKDMADGLGKSSSYVSAMELFTGKQLTIGYASLVARYFERFGVNPERIWKAADKTFNEVDLSDLDGDDRELVQSFARRAPSFDRETRARLKEIMEANQTSKS